MGFFQRDLLLRQIEQLAGALVRRLTDQPVLELRYDISEEEIARAAGLSLSVAAGLPYDTVVALLGGDPQRLLVLGLGLAWWSDRPADRAKARRMVDAALHASPSLSTSTIQTAREGI